MASKGLCEEQFASEGVLGRFDLDFRSEEIRSRRSGISSLKWPAGEDAAYAYLTNQKGVDQSRIAVGGASCGVTLPSDLATRHHEIKALMLLSGTASEAAKVYVAGNASLPVFGAASEGDTAAAKGKRWSKRQRT